MGSIKQGFIKRFGKKLVERHKGRFKTSFEHNKKALAEMLQKGELECPSKSVRNRLAGYLVHVMRPKSAQTYRPPAPEKTKRIGRRRFIKER